MLLRQLFNHHTFSYTYFLADPLSQEAALIDPVKDKLRDYVQLFNELGYTIKVAIDTHTHDDHVSALPVLADLWGTTSIRGASSRSPSEGRVVVHGEIINIGVLQLQVLHTPGHTEDSYCFHLQKGKRSTVFTGDTMLVRTVGLSDQSDSNPRQHYHSLMGTLCQLPPNTVVYPGKDFKGWPLSTISEEMQFNPYLNARNEDEFVRMKQHQRPADITPWVVNEEVEPSTEKSAPAPIVPEPQAPQQQIPEDIPAAYKPVAYLPVEDIPAEDTLPEDIPAEDTLPEDIPAEDTPAEDTPAEDTLPQETAMVELSIADVTATDTATTEPAPGFSTAPASYGREPLSAVEKLANLNEGRDANAGGENPGGKKAGESTVKDKPMPSWR